MAKVTIASNKVLSETRKITLGEVPSGRSVKIDNPQGETSYYIVNKIPNTENLTTKKSTIPLTNYGSGRLVQKRANMLVTPVSVEVLIKVFPEMNGNQR